jgi:MFS family permease
MIRSAAQFSAGGSWTDLLPQQVRRNLRFFWFDGLFASASEAIIATFQVLFLMALGASNAQIGILSAITSLVAVLMLLPGMIMPEQVGKRKRIALISGGILGRLILLVMILVPVFLEGSAAVIIAILLSIARDGLNNFGAPAWTSLTADLVPLAWRGRYFGSRNFIMGVAAMIMTLLMGEMITRSGSIQGYQVAYLIAFGIGMISTYSFSRIVEPTDSKSETPPPAFSWRSLPSLLRGYPVFLVFCIISALWNFSLNISGPFFTVYQVEVLGATATMVAVLNITSQVSSLLTQQPFGALTDRWGARRVLTITGLLIPFLPLVWIFITDVRQGILVNIFGGALWAGYSLAAFNYLLMLTPPDMRARFSALYQIIVALSLSAGAALGSLIITHWGFKAVFLVSAVGRMSAAILFVFFSRRKRG